MIRPLQFCLITVKLFRLLFPLDGESIDSRPQIVHRPLLRLSSVALFLQLCLILSGQFSLRFQLLGKLFRSSGMLAELSLQRRSSAV